MLGKTYSYLVYTNPKADHPEETAEFIRDGFAFWALVLNVLWLVWKRMWWPAVVFAALFGVNAWLRLDGYLSMEQSSAVDFGIALFLAYHALEWYGNSLESRGYELADIVSGRSQTEAEERFCEHVAKRKAHPMAG